jgi:hypothetical protein
LLRRGLLPVIEKGLECLLAGDRWCNVILDVPRSGFWEYTGGHADLRRQRRDQPVRLVGVGRIRATQKDVPVQINGNDLVASLLAGIGPNGAKTRSRPDSRVRTPW